MPLCMPIFQLLCMSLIGKTPFAMTLLFCNQMEYEPPVQVSIPSQPILLSDGCGFSCFPSQCTYLRAIESVHTCCIPHENFLFHPWDETNTIWVLSQSIAPFRSLALSANACVQGYWENGHHNSSEIFARCFPAGVRMWILFHIVELLKSGEGITWALSKQGWTKIHTFKVWNGNLQTGSNLVCLTQLWRWFWPSYNWVQGVNKMADRGNLVRCAHSKTAMLIKALSENSIQSHLLGSKSNTTVFEKIMEALPALNYEWTVKYH